MAAPPSAAVRPGVPVAEPRLARPGRHDRVGPAGPGDLATLLAFRVHPVGQQPGPGELAGLGLPPQVGRGDDHRRPGPPSTGAVSSCPCSARSPPPGTSTGSRSGSSPASPPRTSSKGPTTWPTGTGPCCAGSGTAKSGAVVLEFVRRDVLAAVIPAQPIPARPDLKALPVGRREDGLPWLASR
jgi:hypothetical protein